MPDNDPILGALGSSGPGMYAELLKTGLVPGASATDQPQQQAGGGNPYLGIGATGAGGKAAYAATELLKGFRQGRLLSYMGREMKQQRQFEGDLAEIKAMMIGATPEQQMALAQTEAQLIQQHVHPIMGGEQKPQGKKGVGGKIKSGAKALAGGMAGPNLPESGEINQGWLSDRLRQIGAPGMQTQTAAALAGATATVKTWLQSHPNATRDELEKLEGVSDARAKLMQLYGDEKQAVGHLESAFQGRKPEALLEETETIKLKNRQIKMALEGVEEITRLTSSPLPQASFAPGAAGSGPLGPYYAGTIPRPNLIQVGAASQGTKNSSIWYMTKGKDQVSIMNISTDAQPIWVDAADPHRRIDVERMRADDWEMSPDRPARAITSTRVAAIRDPKGKPTGQYGLVSIMSDGTSVPIRDADGRQLIANEKTPLAEQAIIKENTRYANLVDRNARWFETQNQIMRRTHEMQPWISAEQIAKDSQALMDGYQAITQKDELLHENALRFAEGLDIVAVPKEVSGAVGDALFNPGNIKGIDGSYTRYKDAQGGWDGLRERLTNYMTGKNGHGVDEHSTILEMAEKAYCPRSDGNDPEAWAKNVVSKIPGATINTPIGDLKGRLNDFAKGVGFAEGTHVPFMDVATAPPEPRPKSGADYMKNHGGGK